MTAPASPDARLTQRALRHARTRLALKWLIGTLFVGVLAVFFAFDGQRYLSLDAVKQNRDALQELTRAHYLASLLIGFVVYTTATAFSVPSGIVLSLALGFLFGRWVATALIVVGGTIGATLLFVCARYLFAEPVRNRLGPAAKRINEGFTRDGFSWLLFLRLTPVVPYFLVNLAPAVTDIRVRTYVLATFVGVLPSTLVFTNLGQALGAIESTRDLLAPETIAAFAGLGLVALAPIAIRRWRSKRP